MDKDSIQKPFLLENFDCPSTGAFSFDDGSEIQIYTNQQKANSDILFGLSHEQKQVSKPLFGLTVSLIAGSVGSGYLSLPKAFACYGLIWGSLMMIIAAINGIYSIKMMSKIMSKYKNCEFYADVIEKILGKKAKKFMVVVYIINLFGSLVAYSLIANTFVMNLIQPYLSSKYGYELNDPHFQRFTQLTGLAILVISSVPIQLLTTTSIFKKIGFFTIFTLMFVLCVTCMETPEYMKTNNSEVKMINFENPLLIVQNLGMFTFNTYILDMIFIVKADMGKVTEKRIFIVGASTMFTMVIPFLLFGIVGYLSLGNIALSMDLYPDRIPIAGQSDYLMMTVKVLMTIVILVGYLMRFIALKLQLFSLVGKEITNRYNMLYTITLLFIPAAIGYVYPAVNDWIGLIGAFCMTTLGTTFPAMMTVKEMENEKGSSKKKLKIRMVKIWGFVFTTVGYVSAIAIILKMAHVTK